MQVEKVRVELRPAFWIFVNNIYSDFPHAKILCHDFTADHIEWIINLFIVWEVLDTSQI